MKLRGIDFGPVWDASGVRGFFGEGYAHHKLVPGLDLSGSTFVSKTTPLEPRQGNMPLKKDFTPEQFLPKCIVVKPRKLSVLNAVGLSSPGAKALFETGRWQDLKKPFFISFMSVGNSPITRLEETAEFCDLFSRYLPHFRSKVGLQMNLSCPNVGVAQASHEMNTALSIAWRLGIPVVAKLCVTTPTYLAASLLCDGLCVSNSIPWGACPERIDWKGIFGSEVSPLADLGGGGLSGAPLLPLVVDWVIEAKKIGISLPINAGGGIMSPDDVDWLFRVGASSIFIGSVTILRGWRTRRVIKRANERRAGHGTKESS